MEVTEDEPKVEAKGQSPRLPLLRGPVFVDKFSMASLTLAPLALICLLWPVWFGRITGWPSGARACTAPEATSMTAFLNSAAQGNMLEPHGLAIMEALLPLTMAPLPGLWA